MGAVTVGGARRLTLDFFFSDTEIPTHLRICEGDFLFTHADVPPGERRSMAALCRALACVAPAVPRNPGVDLVDRPADDAAWDNLRFSSEREFDQYNLWFLQLSGVFSKREA
jgi:hypothetical protein